MPGSFEIDIRSSTKSYGVVVGQGIARDFIDASDSMLICDQILLDHYAWLKQKECIQLKAEEDFKTLDSVGMLIEQLRKHGANRGSLLTALGGGIVQDLATFTASSYMRGIRWNYCPTTLLGMADSCIGGKSSINVGSYKNIAGNFYPPDTILIDTEFCASLKKIQMIEGLCEAVKICFASRDDAFEHYMQLAGSGDAMRDQTLIARIIVLTLGTKKTFIEADEFDNGIRLLLNFGHTFGHALEGASGYRISHGIAVGLGMLASFSFSEAYGLTNRSCLRAARLRAYLQALLSQIQTLADELCRISPDECLSRFMSDKKHSSDHFAIIAFTHEGTLDRWLVPRTPENERSIRQAFISIERELNEVQRSTD